MNVVHFLTTAALVMFAVTAAKVAVLAFAAWAVDRRPGSPPPGDTGPVTGSPHPCDRPLTAAELDLYARDRERHVGKWL